MLQSEQADSSFYLWVAMTTGMKQNTVAETHHEIYVAFVLLVGTSDGWYKAGHLTAHRSTYFDFGPDVPFVLRPACLPLIFPEDCELTVSVKSL